MSTVTSLEFVHAATGGTLKVITSPSDADIYVSGTLKGTTNQYGGQGTISGLSDGTYPLRLSKSGYKDWTKQITIVSGQTTTVYAYLEPGTGTSTTRSETIVNNTVYGSLKVNTGVTGINVFVDAEYGGTSDSYSGATVNGLVAGTYLLKLSMTGYKDWTKQVSIAEDKTTTVYAYLESGNGDSTTRNETLSYNLSYGSLKVNTGINDVNVYVGGEFGGLTNYYSGRTINGLVPGTYVLKLVLSGYKEWTKQVNVVSGQTTTVYAYLEPGTGTSITRNETLFYDSALGSLDVDTGLDGVGVFVGGEYGGKTEGYWGATVNGLVAGVYTLRLSLPGYKDWTKQVSITVGKTTTVYGYLENGTGTSVTRSETLAYDSPYGSLDVDTGLDGVGVFVGGEYGGKTEGYWGATVNGLVAGVYTLRLSLPGYKDWTKQVSITVGKTTTVYGYLENGTGTSVTRSETLAYDSPYGSLDVDTGLDGVGVFVGGEYGGKTEGYWGATVNGLVAGVYNVKLIAKGYTEWTQEVTINIGQTATVQATLVPLPSSSTDFVVTASAGTGGTLNPSGTLFTTSGA
jgi:predicted RNA-binding protein (virulence factor B family)